MRAEITLRNYDDEVETFELPIDKEEFFLFVGNMGAEQAIESVIDKYEFLEDLYKYNSLGDYYSSDLSDLIELIEINSINKKETCIKILYHRELNDSLLITDIVDNFNDIEDTYTIYSDYDNTAKWAEFHNEEYKFVDIDDTQKIFHNFNHNLKELYLRNLTATVDMGEQLQEDIFDMNLSDMLDTVEDMGMLKVLDINGYLDWEQIVKDLRASAVYIDKFKDIVIVHNG